MANMEKPAEGLPERVSDHYVPPTQETIEAYAHAVFEALGEDYSNALLARDLGRFLMKVGTMHEQTVTRPIHQGPQPKDSARLLGSHATEQPHPDLTSRLAKIYRIALMRYNESISNHIEMANDGTTGNSIAVLTPNADASGEEADC